MDILPELATYVRKKRNESYESANNQKQLRLVRAVKGVKEINLTNFYRRFA
jgi:hypothetical protein